MNPRTIVKKLLPTQTRELLRKKVTSLFPQFSAKRISYSQEGEDLVLARIFEHKKNSGFFVDIGAHHPFRFSNTYYFYKMGWRGINVDAMPGSMKLFNKHRNRDVNIESGVSDKVGRMTYYIFNDGALNGFNKDLSDAREKETSYKVIKTVETKVDTLSSILHKNMPENGHIDFLSVDVEGLDLQVLQSNDWATYQPSVICIESLDKKVDDIAKDPIAQYLAEKGYSPFAKTYNTVFYLHKDFLAELDV